jgi:hypothetical protein
VSAGLAAVGLLIAVGGVVSTSGRDTRAAVLGLAVVLVFAPAEGLPVIGILPLAIRLVGAILAAYLVAIAVRGAGAELAGARLGWPVQAVAAGAGWIAGYGAYGLGLPALGPAAAQAAAFALVVVAIEPVVRARDAVRLGIGLVLLAAAASLLRTSLLGPPPPLEEVGWATLIVATAAGTAMIAISARSSGGTFELADVGLRGRARVPDAHPVGDGSVPEVRPVAASTTESWTARLATRQAGASATTGDRPPEPDLRPPASRPRPRPRRPDPRAEDQRAGPSG